MVVQVLLLELPATGHFEMITPNEPSPCRWAMQRDLAAALLPGGVWPQGVPFGAASITVHPNGLTLATTGTQLVDGTSALL